MGFGRHLAAVAGMVVFSVVLSVTAMASAASMNVYNTTSGHVLFLPAIEDVSCAEITGLVQTIDATAYRRFEPNPPTHPDDLALFQYEVALAQKALTECRAIGGALRESTWSDN